MTPQEFRAILKRHGLRQADAAYMAGVNTRQACGWANGENRISQSVALLLIAYDEGVIEPEWLARKIAEMKAKEKAE
jgi:transcriptional regulator with XRE-family HTH domain